MQQILSSPIITMVLNKTNHLALAPSDPKMSILLTISNLVLSINSQAIFFINSIVDTIKFENNLDI
jgi:hypothetical protein